MLLPFFFFFFFATPTEDDYLVKCTSLLGKAWDTVAPLIKRALNQKYLNP